MGAFATRGALADPFHKGWRYVASIHMMTFAHHCHDIGSTACWLSVFKRTNLWQGVLGKCPCQLCWAQHVYLLGLHGGCFVCWHANPVKVHAFQSFDNHWLYLFQDYALQLTKSKTLKPLVAHFELIVQAVAALAACRPHNVD